MSNAEVRYSIIKSSKKDRAKRFHHLFRRRRIIRRFDLYKVNRFGWYA